MALSLTNLPAWQSVEPFMNVTQIHHLHNKHFRLREFSKMLGKCNIQHHSASTTVMHECGICTSYNSQVSDRNIWVFVYQVQVSLLNVR